MKKLVKMFKSLPREVRMLIAMAGLASPIGIIYLLKRVLFPGLSTLMVIFIVMGLVAVLCLVGFVVAKLFGRGGKRRSKKMASELGREDSQGPVSVDVRASIKANNDKFFAAIKDMRKTFAVSVYDLPWYVVMGDSGCGKTRLINNGGLIFAAGRPEGYQLGTLNYNWWFSQDAVFVDMAGRLCNPQEDADHKEWQAFLSTIAKGRKGFPINGALLCISAEHLLQDSPEKHETDANVALERLREMQSKLGVTFATYLVITKCDKILGFMQFFDRAGRDISIKNQIFGWSRPGRFNEMYDPEGFTGDFESLYHRLNDLRMRRLNDDVDETERGLAYSFPEEFRELRDPMQTYLRTLFPPLKNPKGIKNLIFRGIYFTSATQEGELILKHLTERLGSEAANQFPTLDSLYPEKRPLFVKDVLFQKVFPEQGLVFRNEADVVRNRKLAKLLKVGSVCLFVILAVTLWWSAAKLTNLMTDPRRHALAAPLNTDEPRLALEKGQELSADLENLEANRTVAYVLSMFIGADKPIEAISSIRARLFEDGAFADALDDIERALQAGAKGADGSTTDEAAKAHMNALEQYVMWFGCIDEPHGPKDITYEGFKTMWQVVTDPDSIINTHRDTFEREALGYFTFVNGRGDWDNPARFLKDQDRDPTETIQQGVKQVHGYMFEHYAKLGNSSNDTVREWMRIHGQCVEIERTYDIMLGTDLRQIQTVEGLRDFSEQFQTSFKAFGQSLDSTEWQDSGAAQRFRPLSDALLELRQFWIDYDQKLTEALTQCDFVAEGEVRQVIPSLRDGGGPENLVSLDQVLWESLKTAELTGYPWKKDQGYYEPETFKKHIREVYDTFPHIISFVEGETGQPDRIQDTTAARSVRSVLQEINKNLEAAGLGGSSDATSDTAALWNQELEGFLYEDVAESAGPDVPPDLGDERWHRDELARLNQEHLKVIRLGQGRAVLERIASRLAFENSGNWGFAELEGGWRTPETSAYSIGIPAIANIPDRPTREMAPEQPRGRKTNRRPPRSRKSRQTPTSTPVRTRRPTPNREGEVPASATPPFVDRRADECARLTFYLRDFADFYLQQEDADLALHDQCEGLVREAWERYAQTYATEWAAAYDDLSLVQLPKLAHWDEGWTVFARQFTKNRLRDVIDPRKVADELEPTLREILRSTRWVTFAPGLGWWRETGDEMDNEWRQVGDAFEGAIQEAWTEDSFAVITEYEAAGGRRNDPPWAALAGEFAERWNQLTYAIGKSFGLEAKFRKKRKARFEKIPWGEIQSLRERARLDGEKLTERIVSFEENAQQLLSAELTRILFDIQKQYLGHEDPPDGWPYTTAGWPTDSGMQTVDFGAFKEFLSEVKRAQEMFKPLEDNLGDNEVRQARLQFYTQCNAWFDFLAIRGDALTATPLELKVHGADPLIDREFKTKVGDTAQHHYLFTELSIGLKLTSDDSGSSGAGGALRLSTDAEKAYDMHDAVWDWETQGVDSDVTVALVEPRGDLREVATARHGPKNVIIGKSSPLALCAYIHAYGYGEGPVWKTLNKFQLSKVEDPEEKELGVMYVFNFDRPMPRSIKKLEQASDIGIGGH